MLWLPGVPLGEMFESLLGSCLGASGDSSADGAEVVASVLVVSTPVVTVGWVCSVVVGSCALPKSTSVVESMGLEVDT